MTEQSNRSTCNYVSLGKYNGSALGDGAVAFVQYPQLSGVQIVPQFKGVSYEVPNYDSLVHGACNNYPNVNQAYIDGDCVKYVERPCKVQPGPNPQPGPKPQPVGAFGYRCDKGSLGPYAKNNCVRVNEAPNASNKLYSNAQACEKACGLVKESYGCGC